MALVNPPALSDVSSSIHNSRHFSWTAGFPDLSRFSTFHDRPGRFHDVNSSSWLGGLRFDDINALAALESTQSVASEEAVSSQTRPPCSHIPINHVEKPPQNDCRTNNARPQRPFRKWMRSLQRRVSHRDHGEDVWPPDAGWEHIKSSSAYQRSLRNKFSHRISSSGSSFGFVAAIQSASMSLASASAFSRSRRHNRHSHCRSRTDRSSRASASAPRFSEDSMPLERVKVDVAAVHRSLRRRQILEELISTEESYIGDVRYLINTYINMLAALPTLPERLRSSIHHNLDEILQLHDDILGELHRVVPDSEYTQADHPAMSSKLVNRKNDHRRLSSLDVLPAYQNNLQWLEKEPGISSEPQVAAEVAKVFTKYEVMIKDASSALKSLPEWEMHQKGLESFAFTLESSHDGEDRKSLTIGDLLVKRICKYPLLFAELLRCTPVIDCPNSHMEVETALVRLREATSAINRSTEDDLMKGALEKTWLLQDRIVFADRTEMGFDGQYMICLLYKDVLCLASGGKFDTIYTILACIDVHSVTVEDANNGRGLQCHLAPFSWKLAFESDHQLYELVMTACTSEEETTWRNRLHRPPGSESSVRTPGLHTFLSLDIQSLGAVFGRPGTVARSLSVHRTTAVGPEASLCRVILKNTSSMRPSTGGTDPLNRSQSLLSTKARLPVLAPPRSERARLEVLLADVWSQDVLPLPSMTSIARNEHMVRRSASTVMRKLSVASMSKTSRSVTRRASEDPSIECHARQTSMSSDSGVDIFDKAGREESSYSHTTKSSVLPETREQREEEDCKSGTMTPKLELTRISELRPLDMIEIISKKKLESNMEDTAALLGSAINKIQASSSRSFQKLNKCSTTKENLAFWADAAAQSKDAPWANCTSSKGERKSIIRRFFWG
ncbi:hypothetical protein F66182_4010 [Fusarium sp. NRRL 66182]|nr:hypothetical protein F66182_4010 [Fusarium sp. NRRL 66182]